MEQFSFSIKVWALCDQIPLGQITTYGMIATAMGNPNATRAVGTALSKNPLAPTVPCHRVLPSSMKIGGYSGSTTNVDIKRQLLHTEGVQFYNNRCVQPPWSNFKPLTVSALKKLQHRIESAN